MSNYSEKKQTFFDTKVKPILNYVGMIGAIIMSIAYIIVVFVLINGFKVEELLHTTVFACVNAAVGFIIMQFLKIQGVSFAKMIPENKAIMDIYYKTETKDKKVHSITYYWITSVVKDVLMKCLTLGATTVGVIYIVIQGSNDYNLLLLAVVNLLMFICFGFISLVKAYDFFNQMHIPFLIKRLEEVSSKELDEVLPKEAKEEAECLALETKNSETCKNKS